jgi:hypothetical protein
MRRSKSTSPIPKQACRQALGVAARSLNFRGFGIAQHLPLSGARDNIVPLEHPATAGRKGSFVAERTPTGTATLSV